MRTLLGMALLVALFPACTRARYVPVHSPQPPTACPDERELANRARENAVGRGGGPWRAMLGSAVLLHARCEHKALVDMELDAVDEGALIDQFERARLQFHTVQNLYSEVLHHRDRKIRTEAEIGLAALHSMFTAKLRAVPGLQPVVDDVAASLEPSRPRS